MEKPIEEIAKNSSEKPSKKTILKWILVLIVMLVLIASGITQLILEIPVFDIVVGIWICLYTIFIIAYLIIFILFLTYSKRKPKPEKYLISIFKENVEAKDCYLCKQSFIEVNDQIAQCSNCREFFHSEHLKKWLENETTCPHCKKELYFY